jgi:hypothetical protein
MARQRVPVLASDTLLRIVIRNIRYNCSVLGENLIFKSFIPSEVNKISCTTLPVDPVLSNSRFGLVEVISEPDNQCSVGLVTTARNFVACKKVFILCVFLIFMSVANARIRSLILD